MVDEDSPAAQLSQAILLSGLDDRVVHATRMVRGALELEARLPRHPLPQRHELAAGGLDLGGVHELHLAQRSPGGLLDHRQRIRARDLEVEAVHRGRDGVVAAFAPDVVDPVGPAPEQHELVVGQPGGDAFGDAQRLVK